MDERMKNLWSTWYLSIMIVSVLACYNVLAEFKNAMILISLPRKLIWNINQINFIIVFRLRNSVT